MYLRIFAALIGVLLPAAAHAQWVLQIPPCPVGAILPCAPGGGSIGAANYIGNILLPAVRLGFITIATIYFFIYAGKLLINSDEESTITDTKNAYSNAVVGAAIISLSGFIVQGFGRAANTTLINPAPVILGINNVIGYFKLVIGVLISVVIVTQGVRLIILEGQEGEIEKQRKKFFHSLLGVVVIMLANALVTAVQPGANSIVVNEEVRGFIDFGLTLLVALAVGSIMVAGVMLMLATDDTKKDTAKKIIFGAVISLVMVVAAYSIVNFFLLL